MSNYSRLCENSEDSAVTQNHLLPGKQNKDTLMKLKDNFCTLEGVIKLIACFPPFCFKAMIGDLQEQHQLS